MSSRWMAAFMLSPILAMATAIGRAQSSNAHEQCSHKKTPEDAPAAMWTRGEHAMGFSQTETAHHFLLKRDGGVIAVSANDAKDSTSRDRIRAHLHHIAEAFAEGDFDIPMFVHDSVPPGVTEMKQLQERIHYTFEEKPNGGCVIIATADKRAIDAIHRFLRFQIQEHHTGDSQ